MKRTFSIALGAFLLLPNLAFAACSNEGYTVVFINGIFDTREQADADKLALKDKLSTELKNKLVDVQLAYNPTHLNGAGDLTQSLFQLYGSSISNYDLNTILLQMYGEVATRKLLVVGHSQGAVYANNVYSYLTGHGEPVSALGVYNVASMANYTAGGGKYLTAKEDSIIAWAADMATKLHALPPLPPNIDLPLTDDQAMAMYSGHSFADYYLPDGGARIVSDIDSGLSALSATDSAQTDTCFTPPDKGLIYQTEEIFFAVADPTVMGAVQGTQLAYAGASVALGTTLAALDSAYNSITGFFWPAPTGTVTTNTDTANFSIVKTLYGSSLSPSDVQDLLSTNQGGVAVLAAPQGEVLGTSTITTPTIPIQNLTPVTSPGFGGGGSAALATNNITSSPTEDDTVSTTSNLSSGRDDDIATTSDDTATSTGGSATSTSPAQNSDGIVLASQPDFSTLCTPDWRTCYTGGLESPERAIDLGSGATFANASLLSVTIAKDETSPFATNPWIISILCYTDASYSTPCPDWVTPNTWNANQPFVAAEFATTTQDSKFWTAYFTDPTHESNYSDHSSPVTFTPGYYYRLLINDNGWEIGAYGNETEPYFVLRGEALTANNSDNVATTTANTVETIASQTDESTYCDWRTCFTGDTNTPYALVELGAGSQYQQTVLWGVTISASETFPWTVGVACYDDNAYTQFCASNPLMVAAATSTADNQHWTAYMPAPYSFDSAKYYKLYINDNGDTANAWGSATVPYFVMFGSEAPVVE